MNEFRDVLLTFTPQDARVLPGCLHSYCKGCLDTHAGGAATFPCPTPSCPQV